MSYWPRPRTVRNRGMLALLIAASLSSMAIYAQDPLKTLPNKLPFCIRQCGSNGNPRALWPA